MSRRRRDEHLNSTGNDDASVEASLKVRVHRSGSSGFAAAKGSDGYYYITKVPKNYTQISVGDRIIDINGVSQDNFRHKNHVNELLNSFQLEVEPKTENDDENDEESNFSEGDYEEYNRDRSSKEKLAASTNEQKRNNSHQNGRKHNQYYDDDDNETERTNRAGRAAAAAAAVAARAPTASNGRNSRHYDDYLDIDDDDDDDERSQRYSDDDDDENDGNQRRNRREEDEDESEKSFRGPINGQKGYDDGDENDEHFVDECERARVNAEKRNKSDKMPNKEDFERPYVSKYKPNSRFMITVTKDSELPDHGVILAEYKTKWTREIYVADVEPHGPFYKTALDRGDKILAINGRKHPIDFKSVQQANRILESKAKCTLFVMRPDPKTDEGYKWVMANT
ncbi:PDZ domain containing protein [Nitzschia inconspicua]|uniref:PDZ domain containing protein n=2 Tax=Nitzschia inconspicua TaxID=303405 RepID=A0A9K3PKN0_9STRA|nr:PDZ domain containing protein [Nitzschia inconspicua]